MKKWIVCSCLLIFASTCVSSTKDICKTITPDIYSRCREILVNGLESQSFWARMHAAEGLTSAGKTEIVLQTLPPMLEKETDDSKRCGLAREIVRAGDKSKIKILSRILADPNSNGRGHATESLYKIEKLGNLDLLVKCAGDDEHRKVQMWSCAALVRAGHKEFLPVLRRFVSSNDPLENSLSTYILGQLGEIRQKELVKERLKEQPKSLYSFFYTAGLVYMKDECALQQLPEFFESKDETIRSLAINTAGTVNPYRFKQKAINMLKDSADNVRIRAAHALINMK